MRVSWLNKAERGSESRSSVATGFRHKDSEIWQEGHPRLLPECPLLWSQARTAPHTSSHWPAAGRPGPLPCPVPRTVWQAAETQQMLSSWEAGVPLKVTVCSGHILMPPFQTSSRRLEKGSRAVGDGHSDALGKGGDSQHHSPLPPLRLAWGAAWLGAHPGGEVRVCRDTS